MQLRRARGKRRAFLAVGERRAWVTVGERRAWVAVGDRRASVAVEFALCATFFLLPLYCAAADFITILNAQAQLNTALQALVYYGWTNPGAAVAISNATTTSTETSLISLIDNAPSTFHVTLNAGSVSGSYSTLQYYCVTTTTTPYTITANASATCGTGQTLETYAQFTVSTTVILPFPVPAQLGNPYPLSATGSAQVQ